MAFFTDNFRTPKQIDWETFNTQKNAFETDDPEFSGTIKARVPKFSDVKPGQQHPVGKHGQGKLFHEHVWPKGFTPERRAEIGNVMPYLRSHTETEKDPDWGSQHPVRDYSDIYDTIARSTIHTDELEALHSGHGMEIHMGVPHSGTTAGTYHPSGESDLTDVNPNSAVISLRNRKQNEDMYKGALTGKTLIHEIGHALDQLSDPEGFETNLDITKEGMYNGENGFLPAAEGRAMGYQLAKFRATRAQTRTMRAGGVTQEQGYTPKRISDSKYSDNRVPAVETFKSNRIKAFRLARGEKPYPEKAPMGKKEPQYDQPRLPGM
jgi:hypothetical protein